VGDFLVKRHASGTDVQIPLGGEQFREAADG
jgi:hypothetical protein